MTDTIEAAGAPALSEAETKYFETGGEAELPAETTETAETGETASGEPEGGKKDETETKPNLVPHQALHEQRERRKAAEKRARELELENTKFRERFNVLKELQSPAQETKAPPKPEEDIFGAFEHVSKELSDLQKRVNDGDAEKKHQSQIGELVNHYKNDAAEFEAKTPDFKAAYNHLLGSRARELMALGYETRAELEEALRNEEMSIATMAFQKGRSPAEVIYNLAKERGYKKVDPKAETEAKLDTIERGSSLNKSLSSASGSSGEDEMTAERLLAMPNDEFETWCEKNPQKAKRLMGA